MRTWMVLVLMVVPAVAAARPRHPVVEAIEGLGTPAGDKHLAECALAILPSGELRRDPRTLTVKDLGLPDGATLAVTKLASGQFGKTELEWVNADVDARVAKKVVAKLRLVAIGTSFIPDDRAYPVLVAHWVKPVTDKVARTLTIAAPTYKDETVPAPKEIASEQARADYDELLHETYDGSDDVNGLLAAGAADGGLVIGSGPGEVWKGKAGSKAIKAWKTKLKQAGGELRIGVGRAHVLVTRYDGAVPYVAMLAYGDMMTGGGSMVASFALASFAVPQ